MRAAGVNARYDTTIQSLDELGGYDLIVAADGLNSLVRRGFEKEFCASVSHSTNKFAWYGTSKRFATLSQTFVNTDLGSFNAHHYRYSPSMSTFLVECDAWRPGRPTVSSTRRSSSRRRSARGCPGGTLDGHSLVSNKSVWRNFPWIWNENWSHGNMVLIGDALHTAHFSIGSGTRLAIEDAIALTKALEAETEIAAGPRPLPGRAQADRAEAGDGGAHQRRLVRTFRRTHEARPDGFCLQLHQPLRADRRRAAARDVAGIHGALRGGKEDREPGMTSAISDLVPRDNPGAREIGFAIPESYNAARILFDNLSPRRGDRLALTGPGGTRTYAELCAEASQWGHGFQSLGLKRGDRILMFLDDTPAYPAAFFGAVRSGFVPLLINTLTPPDLLQFYLSDAGAAVAVAEAEFTSRFNAEACKDTPLQTLVVVNGAAGEHAVPKALIAQQWLQGYSHLSAGSRHQARRHGVLDVFIRLDRTPQGHRTPAARHGL